MSGMSEKSLWLVDNFLQWSKDDDGDYWDDLYDEYVKDEELDRWNHRLSIRLLEKFWSNPDEFDDYRFIMGCNFDYTKEDYYLKSHYCKVDLPNGDSVVGKGETITIAIRELSLILTGYYKQENVS